MPIRNVLASFSAPGFHNEGHDVSNRERPQMHYSGLEDIWRCGEYFRRRHIEKERKPPMSYIHVGRGVDEAANLNLAHKIETEALLPVEQVTEHARDTVRHSIEESGLVLAPEEIGLTEKAAADQAVDKAVRLSKTHALRLAPELKPARVQAKWSIEIPGFPFDLVGTRDLDETDGTTRDLKSSKRTPAKDLAEKSDQMSVYTLARWVIDKIELPAPVAIDTVVDLKTGTKVETRRSTRDRDDFQVIVNRAQQAARIIESGIFTPASQERDWICSLRWCSFAPTCKFFRKPKSFVLEEGE